MVYIADPGIETTPSLQTDLIVIMFFVAIIFAITFYYLIKRGKNYDQRKPK